MRVREKRERGGRYGRERRGREEKERERLGDIGRGRGEI